MTSIATPEAVQQQIDQIVQQMAELRPMTDADMANATAAGEDLDTLVTQAGGIERKRRVLEVRLSQLAQDLAQAEQQAARPHLSEHAANRSRAIVQARKALSQADDAVTAFVKALEAFDNADKAATQAAIQANTTARRVGLPEQVARPELGHTEAFHLLEQRLVEALRPYRRPGSQLNKYDLAHN
jgi:chromosome segregation ATPase